MPNTLNLLLEIYAGTIALNVLIAAMQLRENRGLPQKAALYAWIAMFLNFFLQGVFPELNLLAVFAVSTNFFAHLFLSEFVQLSMGVGIPRRALFKLFAAAWVGALALAAAGAPFQAYSAPVLVATSLPTILMFCFAMKRENRERLSSLQKFFLFTMFVWGLHLLDYPILRPYPGAAIFGFTLAYILVHISSILLPMLATESVYREYSHRLENEVAQKTQLLLNSSRMAALGEMAGGIAHEINTPLAIIKVNCSQLVEVLEDEQPDPAILKEMATAAESAADRAAKVITGLRAFSRDGSGDPKQIQKVGAILADILPFCGEKFKSSGMRLECGEVDQSLEIPCRPAEVSQVLLNLLNNAYDAIEPLQEKWVRIQVRRSGRFAEIAIVDSGGGVPGMFRAKIFQPFFTTKEIGKGTGLGLSVSAGVVASHGGELTLDEACPNTRFVLKLPLADAPKSTSQDDSPATRPRSWRLRARAR